MNWLCLRMMNYLRKKGNNMQEQTIELNVQKEAEKLGILAHDVRQIILELFGYYVKDNTIILTRKEKGLLMDQLNYSSKIVYTFYTSKGVRNIIIGEKKKEGYFYTWCYYNESKRIIYAIVPHEELQKDSIIRSNKTKNIILYTNGEFKAYSRMKETRQSIEKGEK